LRNTFNSRGNNNSFRDKISRILLFILLSILFVISACAPGSGSDVVQLNTATLGKIQISITPAPTKTVLPPTETVKPSSTTTSTPTSTTTPFEINYFNTRKLLSDVHPTSYIENQCAYLMTRWEPGKSEPGTIVVPVMYHSVRQAGRPVTDPLTVSHEYFIATMNHAKKLGFETITVEQLTGFLKNNDPIPPLSMILIIDDRRPGVVRDHFLPVLEENDWTVTLAYITGLANDWEWKELERLNTSNRLDVQAHGFLHNGSTYFTEWTEPEVIIEEVYNPIPLIEEHFGNRPTAFIWPGGNFTSEAIKIVHEAEYQLGFTAYSRGPLMFNWIPLGDPEIEVNDPLMVLPRYWSSTAYINLDDAVEISGQASAFAEMNRAQEYRWYDAFCQGYPKLSEITTEENNNNG
jgi:hypothetical protein